MAGMAVSLLGEEDASTMNFYPMATASAAGVGPRSNPPLDRTPCSQPLANHTVRPKLSGEISRTSLGVSAIRESTYGAGHKHVNIQREICRTYYFTIFRIRKRNRMSRITK